MRHLFGFLNLVGQYPATVAPVWRDDDGELFGVFTARTKEGFTRQFQALSTTSSVCKLPDDWKDNSIEGCQPLDVCLFALSAKRLIAYPVSQERVILSSLLEDPGFAGDQPFSRLALAKQLGQVHFIVAEIVSCACHLLSEELVSVESSGRERLENWLLGEKRSLSEQYNLNSFQRSNILADFPTTIKELGAMTWWRNQLRVSPSSTKLKLEEIEDRDPSPKTVAILNLEPKVPSGRILGLMAKHLLNGTNYLFFHAPTASKATLEKLREATAGAVQTARDAARGPLRGLSEPAVGEIKFFELDREWTGSPFVFYEEAALGGSRVIGYRGVDIGASIARFYEKLPESVAYELLEALKSNPPKQQFFDMEHPDSDNVLHINGHRRYNE